MINPSIRKSSPVFFAFERLFRGFQYLSLANLLFGSRTSAQEHFTTEEEMIQWTSTRARHVEFYILAFTIIEVVVYLVMSFFVGWGLVIFLVISFYRIFDIIQGAINLNIFDRFRRPPERHYIAFFERAALFSIWNFFELALCFAIIYTSPISSFNSTIGQIDSLFFSLFTQLTIGYGDVVAIEGTRWLVAAQGSFGLLLGVIAFSRLIAMFPQPHEVFPRPVDQAG